MNLGNKKYHSSHAGSTGVNERAAFMKEYLSLSVSPSYFVWRSKVQGEAFYLVPSEWWKRVVGSDQSFSCDDPGVLDYSSLLQADGHTLKDNLMAGLQFYALPQEIWKKLSSWFPALCIIGPEIQRFTLRTGELEIYPLRFQIVFHDQEDCVAATRTASADTRLNVFLRTLVPQEGGVIEAVKRRNAYNSSFVALDLLRSGNSTLGALSFSAPPSVNKLLVIFRREGCVSPKTRLPRFEQPQRSIPSSTAAVSRLPRRGLCGLSNLGNTCYLNAVLQALSHTGRFRSLLLVESKVLARINACNALGQRGQSLLALSALFRILWRQVSFQPVSSLRFKTELDTWTELFRGSRQHDAHELLQFLLDLVHEDSLPSISLEVFGGALGRHLTCSLCHVQTRVSLEPFSILSLPLLPSSCRMQSLPDLIQHFCARETLEGWLCPHCQIKNDATSEYSFQTLPPVLILHLKRFSNANEKLSTVVHFPLVLPLSVEGEVTNYKLKAVIRHHGARVTSGHYDVQISVEGRADEWFTFNDSFVTPVRWMIPGLKTPCPFPNVFDSNAYIFLYQRQ